MGGCVCVWMVWGGRDAAKGMWNEMGIRSAAVPLRFSLPGLEVDFGSKGLYAFLSVLEKGFHGMAWGRSTCSYCST